MSNICRYCFKQVFSEFVNKCENCKSVCCNDCKLTNSDNIFRTMHYTYRVGIVYIFDWSTHNICTQDCMYSMYNNKKFILFHIDNVSPIFGKNWTIKYIQNTLGQHLIKDVNDIVVEYL